MLNRQTTSLYTKACFYELGALYFKGKKDWKYVSIGQARAFRAIVNKKTLLLDRKMRKNPNDPGINIYKVEAILFAFQLWSLF